MIGDGGTIFSPDDYGASFFVKLKDDQKFIHSPSIRRWRNILSPFRAILLLSKDVVLAHAQEWLTAIKENKPENCYSRFDIAARLTEIMLLGCVSFAWPEDRVGRTTGWLRKTVLGRAVYTTARPFRLGPFLERSQSTCSLFWRSPRWLFLDKKPLSLIASGHSNCGTAVVWISPAGSPVKAFLKDESGATAIEYGLIAAGISIAIISAVKGVGTKLNRRFRRSRRS